MKKRLILALILILTLTASVFVFACDDATGSNAGNNGTEQNQSTDGGQGNGGNGDGTDTVEYTVSEEQWDNAVSLYWKNLTFETNNGNGTHKVEMLENGSMHQYDGILGEMFVIYRAEQNVWQTCQNGKIKSTYNTADEYENGGYADDAGIIPMIKLSLSGEFGKFTYNETDNTYVANSGDIRLWGDNLASAQVKFENRNLVYVRYFSDNMPGGMELLLSKYGTTTITFPDWVIEGRELPDETKTAVYKRIDIDGNEAEEGDYIYFGSYPQAKTSQEKREELTETYASELPENGNNKGWTAYDYKTSDDNVDYIWYLDVDEDNDGDMDYRGVYFKKPITSNMGSYNENNRRQENHGYWQKSVYWFKFEPIMWRILTIENGKAIILSQMVIDSSYYSNTKNSREIDSQTVYGNNYEYSAIRAWLNDNFYNTAFSADEKGIINEVEVDNSESSTNPATNSAYYNEGVNEFACTDTNDNVWLLSVKEATTEEYGFNADITATDAARQKKPTDYATCKGVEIKNVVGYVGNSEWMLRSPYFAKGSYYGVGEYKNMMDCSGKANYSEVHITYDGIVPALQITLS